MVLSAGRKKNRTKKVKKVPGGLQEEVRKYGVIAKLASACSGIQFGELLCGDAEEETKQLKRFITRQLR